MKIHSRKSATLVWLTKNIFTHLRLVSSGIVYLVLSFKLFIEKLALIDISLNTFCQKKKEFSLEIFKICFSLDRIQIQTNELRSLFNMEKLMT